MITFDLTNARPRALASQDVDKLAQLLSRALRWRRAVTVSVRFVSLSQMQRLNRDFRQKNRPTDVLSFHAEQLPSSSFTHVKKRGLSEPEQLGDLAICPAYARTEAKRRGLSHREELLRLLTHGVLHLAGYDHATENEELEMFALQEQIIDRVV